MNIFECKIFCKQQVYPQKELTWFTMLPNIHDKYRVFLLGIHIHHFNGFLFYCKIFGQAKSTTKIRKGTLFNTVYENINLIAFLVVYKKNYLLRHSKLKAERLFYLKWKRMLLIL